MMFVFFFLIGGALFWLSNLMLRAQVRGLIRRYDWDRLDVV